MNVENNLITEIRSSIDIVDVISSYIPLVSKGKNYFGVCPFHDDHSPSMSVSKEKQIYTCFSCGATGNVFKFIQDYENVSFKVALKKCADIVGIQLNINLEKKENIKNRELYDIYNLSQKFYQNNINTKDGKKALDYLFSRDLKLEVIKEFGIGLSLNLKDSLTKILEKKYPTNLLIKSGLINENNFELNDVYKNRIMFPLFDLEGRVVGFNGRVYNGETENKYINSKESEIFKKRNLLFNYHRAKDFSRAQKSIIIMEGPMDVIRAYSIGVKNVVATLGTAFSSEQAMLVRRLSSNVILCFDGDEAGFKATKSAIEELEKLGINPKIVRLKDNLDPDEFILKYGQANFLYELENAISVVEFKELLLKKNLNLNNSEELAGYVNKMLLEIDKIEDDILREISIKKLSEEVKLDIELLKSKLTDKSNDIKIPTKRITNTKLNKYQKSERNLLFYMLSNKNVIKMYEKKITHMPTERYRHLAFLIDCFYKKNGYINVADLINDISSDPDAIKTIGEVTSLDLSENYSIEELDDYFRNIKEYNERNQSEIYKNKLSNEHDLSKKIDLANKALEIRRRREDYE